MQLVDTFTDQLKSSAALILAECLDGKSATYYNTSYYIHALCSAVEGLHNLTVPAWWHTEPPADPTPKPTVLDQLVTYCDIMVNQSWGPLDSRGWHDQLSTFQGAASIARAAAIILSTPQFALQYADRARKYIAFVDNLIIKPWFDKTTGVYNDSMLETFTKFKADYPGHLAGDIPWLSPDNGGQIGFQIWNDKCTHLGCIVTQLYLATGHPLYYEMALRIARDFKLRLKPNKTGWIWDDGVDPKVWTEQWYADQSPCHDTSHTNREPFMVEMMYRAGIVFTHDDVLRFCNTLTDTIWNQNLAAPQFTNYIDGTDGPFINQKDPGAIGNIYFGWALLAPYSPKVFQVCYATLEGIMNGQNIGQNNTTYGKLALAGHLLRGLKSYLRAHV